MSKVVRNQIDKNTNLKENDPKVSKIFSLDHSDFGSSCRSYIEICDYAIE